MKTPINRKAITIETGAHPMGIGLAPFWAKAGKKVNQLSGPGMKATSTGCVEGAVNNLALRWFFGGNTNRFVGDEERAAVLVSQLGPNRYRASLRL